MKVMAPQSVNNLLEGFSVSFELYGDPSEWLSSNQEALGDLCVMV